MNPFFILQWPPKAPPTAPLKTSVLYRFFVADMVAVEGKSIRKWLPTQNSKLSVHFNHASPTQTSVTDWAFLAR